MTLYEKIDFLCKTNGITRKELARQTGISYATLNAMFARQSTNISLETIRAIANHFNVSLDYLLADEIDHSVQDGELTQERLNFVLESYKKAEPPIRTAVDKLLDIGDND